MQNLLGLLELSIARQRIAILFFLSFAAMC